MKGKFFIDTNIFVYSFDDSEPKKQSSAKKLIQQALDTGDGMISFQVAQEFTNVALKEFKKPMRTDDYKIYLQAVLTPLCKVFPDIHLLDKAATISNEYKFSFYDSLVIASAISGGCQTIYTEDLKHGQTVESLKIMNPFASTIV